MLAKGGTLKNYWLDERRIRIGAEAISLTLNRTYLGTKTDMDDWSKLALEMMRQWGPRVRDALMWKYTIKFQFDEREHVQVLEFVRLPWLI